MWNGNFSLCMTYYDGLQRVSAEGNRKRPLSLLLCILLNVCVSYN